MDAGLEDKGDVELMGSKLTETQEHPNPLGKEEMKVHPVEGECIPPQKNSESGQAGSVDQVGAYRWPEEHLDRTLENGATLIQILSPVSI